MQNKVMKSSIEYSNEYQIKYYVSHFMYTYAKSLFNEKASIIVNSREIEKKIKDKFYYLRSLFPFWNEVVYVDIENKAMEEFKKFVYEGNNFTVNK